MSVAHSLGRPMLRAAFAARAWALVWALGGCAGVDVVSPEVRQVLAPTGKLRVGLYPGSPTSLIPAAAGGEPRGVGHDLGRELARRLGVSFEPVVFERNAQVMEAMKAGRLDAVFTNATAERAKDMDFAPPLLDLELGYLVPAGSRIASLQDIDRPGVRIGVSQGSTSFGVLSRELKQAAVVATPSFRVAIDMLSSGRLDAFATNKAVLFELSDELRGARVLEGRWGLEHIAFGIPKGRDTAMPYLRAFVEAARADGAVARAVQRAGLRGTAPAGSR